MARVVFFASDLTETAQMRRIRSFQAAGHSVASVSMRKAQRSPGDLPDWPDLSLGEIGEQALGRRGLQILRGLGRVLRGRRMFAGADMFVARNIDMVLLAWIARLTLPTRPPIVYECLDIHALMTAAGAKATLARWIERRMLARTALLVLSSPGFATHYFQARQGYSGRWFLLENKLWFPADPLPRPQAPTPRLSGARLVLGWVGAIRCAPSLDILLAAAAAAPDRLQIRIHGVIHRHALPDFDARIAALPNVTYAGPYSYPEGLGAIYDGCDLVWAQDLWQRGANSDWLLPNRIYEASWFGCPSIAVAGTQTAARIAADGLGIVLPTADADALLAALDALTPAALDRLRRGVLAFPETALAQSPADVDALVAATLPARAMA